MASAFRSLKSIPKLSFMKRELTIPHHFCCPISLDLMKDPVTASTGITYDRRSIEKWLELRNETCPVTKQPLRSEEEEEEEEELIPNHALRRMIQDWCVANRSFGIERITTPRIPVTPTQVSELLSEIASASRRGDRPRCGELATKIRDLGRESARNRRCIISGGAARVLAAAFAQVSLENNPTTGLLVLEEIISALASFFPLDDDEEEALRHIGSPESLKSLVLLLTSGRLDAVLVLKELVSSMLDADRINAAAGTRGLIEALVKLIEEPRTATKASLAASFYLVSSSERAAMRFVEMGTVSLLLDILVDSDKSMCEKALGVLDGALGCEKGRERAYDHPLALPILVKKMFRVSDMATEFAVSALWKLCRNCRQEGREGCLVEALQLGAFQKLLLLLQVGCRGTTKDKASELLKLLNGPRGRGECIEIVDFKGLKRSF